MPDVGHLMSHDQVVLGLDRDLDVVAHQARALAVRGHRPAIRIGQRDLLVGRGVDIDLQRLEVGHLFAQLGDLLPQPLRLRLGKLALLAVGRLQRRQIARDAGLHLLHASLDRGAGEVLVARVHRLEPAAVDRRHRMREQSHLPAQQERLDRMPKAMRIRRATVEHVFGTLKAWMGQTHLRTRTLKQVSTEMSLHVLAYNLKRMIAILGVAPLIQAMTA